MKTSLFIASTLMLVTLGCTKSVDPTISFATKAESTLSANEQKVIPDAFKLQVVKGSKKKTWVSKAKTSTKIGSAVPGVDYSAIRGGINPDELTLISFGNFINDTTGNNGRVTIFLNSVTGIGTFNLGGGSTDYGVLTLVNTDGSLTHFSTDNLNTGVLTVTEYNTVLNTISGNYFFDASNGTSTIRVLNGTFANVPFVQ